MTEEIAVSLGLARPPEAPRADSDCQVLEIWLHGRSRHTQRAYRADVEHFLTWVRKPLPQVTLADLQQFAGANLSPRGTSRHPRCLRRLKSPDGQSSAPRPSP